MADISTIWHSSLAVSYGDWAVDPVGLALVSGDDIVTAVIISCMTDRVLPDGVDSPDGSGDPRGWWGDDPGYPIGSRIWTLLRAKQTDETLANAKAYLIEATQWMIDDGVVASFDVITEWDGPGFLAAEITAHKPTGAPAVINFGWAWQDVVNTAAD